MPRIEKPKVKKTKKPIKRTSQALSKPKVVKPKRVKRNPIDYYTCLTNMAQSGFPNKITACCKSCKQNAPALNVARQQELQKWMENYKRLGAEFLHLFAPPHTH